MSVMAGNIRKLVAPVPLFTQRMCLHSFPATQHSSGRITQGFIHHLNFFQPRNSFHGFRNPCLAKHKGISEANETDLKLLDENGRELGFFTKRKAVDISIDKNLQLGLVGKTDTGTPIYRLVTKENLDEPKEQGNGQSTKKSKSKTLTIKSNIQDHSLDIKLKALDKWFLKGKDVQITINNAVLGSNTDLILVSRKIREKLEDKAKVEQLQATGSNMTLKLQPKSVEPTPRTAVPPLFKTDELRNRRRKEDKYDDNSGDQTEK